jgi:GNAT superfamily N-acetyltransferase
MHQIHTGYIPGCIGRVAELHGVYYARYWQFGSFFEGKVATDLAEFIQRYDQHRDGFWTVVNDDRVEGAIAIDSKHTDTKGAHLRWFIVSEALQGRGLGQQLVQTAIEFCKHQGYQRVYLWTFEGLSTARSLYDRVGFKLVEQHTGQQWGTEVNEQRFELQLST